MFTGILEGVRLVKNMSILRLQQASKRDGFELGRVGDSKTLTLQAVWTCTNHQGYQDQIIFAFDSLRPSIAFIAECSSILVFRYEQIVGQQQHPTIRLVGTA